MKKIANKLSKRISRHTPASSEHTTQSAASTARDTRAAATVGTATDASAARTTTTALSTVATSAKRGRTPHKDLANFVKSLEFSMVKSLKTKSSFTLELHGSRLASYLRDHYKLNYYKYQECDRLIKDLEITTRRFFSDSDFSELLGARFKLRRNKLSYFKNKSVKATTIYGPTLFCARVYVYERVNL